VARQHLLNQPCTFPVLSFHTTYRYEAKIGHTNGRRWKVGVVDRARHLEELEAKYVQESNSCPQLDDAAGN
jgi:hypothetical protein